MVCSRRKRLLKIQWEIRKSNDALVSALKEIKGRRMCFLSVLDLILYVLLLVKFIILFVKMIKTKVLFFVYTLLVRTI